MNFTREPIIETIITPKEGCKLAVRSSKAEGQEEYIVDAVEVVSFGQALFFRSLEKPKPFLVPVGDYEIVEVKESRVVLKSAQFDRTIKIGGGREGPIRRESAEEEESLPPALEEEAAQETAPAAESQFNRKQDRRRHRRRRAPEEREEMRARTLPQESSTPPSQESTSSIFTHLIPPPTTLISETIGRYKEMLTPEGASKPPEEPPSKEEEKDDKGDPSTLSRITTASLETQSFTTTQTNFSNLNDWTNFLS